MSMPAPAGLVTVVMPVTLTTPPPAACRKPTPEPPEIERLPNERIPAELFCRETPSVPPETLVLPVVFQILC
ncbi:MAG: hypothetical protein ACRD9R_03305 [Pyrinomonadaceae bacterium]